MKKLLLTGVAALSLGAFTGTALGCIVVGKVTCPNGKVFDQIVVVVTDSNNAQVAAQQVAADGTYLIDLPAGTYTATLENLPAGLSILGYSVDGGPLVNQPSVTGTLAPNSTTTLDWLVDGPACNAPGTGTPGFWKNHPNAWPVNQITIGGTTFTKQQAIDIMGTAVKGDKRYTMFAQLVSAKLNVLAGNVSSCIDATIAAADAWFATYGVAPVAGSSAAWRLGAPLADMLDAYTNGRLCAPHRD